MSIESVKAYFERIETDEEFRKRVMALRSPEERHQYILSEGFSFTVEEIQSMRDELSEEELDRIAAGIIVGVCCTDEKNSI